MRASSSLTSSLRLRRSLVAVAVAVGAFGISACGGGEEKKDASSSGSSSSSATPSPDGSDYPADVKANYMAACISAGSARASAEQAQQACACTWEYIEKNVDYGDFTEADRQARSGESTATPTWMTAALSSCS